MERPGLFFKSLRWALFACMASLCLWAQAPVIAIQPVGGTVAIGSRKTFSVAVTGTSVTCQWRKNAANISGATSRSYTISSVTAAHAGTYDVVVSNASGSVTSNGAVLNISGAPAITTQPQSATKNVGQSTTFTVVATGTAPLTYQWKKNGAAISGATTASLALSNLQLTDAGTYAVTVSNAAGTATSTDATLTVNAAVAPPVISQQPVNQSVAPGQTATFSVVASGGGTLTYAWYQAGGMSGTLIPGATAASYTTPATTLSDNGKGFYVVVTNSAGSVTSSNATLTVGAGISVSITPAATTIAPGGSGSFTATVSGAQNNAVTWTSSAGTLSSITASAVTWTAGVGNGGGPLYPGTYTLTATSQADPSKSATATITVATIVTVSVTPASATVASGGTQAFNVAVGGTANTAVNWTATGGSLSATTGSSVTWTAPAQFGTYTVRATSQADSSKSSAATVNVPSTVALTLSPLSASVPLEGGLTLVATVTGTTNTGVNWIASRGTLSATTGNSVNWTPTNNSSNATVTAISQADPSKQATAQLTVTSNVVVSVAPASPAVQVGTSRDFTATVTGTPTQTVTWSTNGGTFTGSGTTVTWTAPATAGTYQVYATSQADTTRQATATVTVTAAPPVNISVSPTTVSLAAGEAVVLGATLTGTSNPSANWTSTAAGSLSSSSGASVTWTAPQVAGTYSVTAAAAAEPARTATVTIHVNPAVCTPVN